MSKYEEDRIYRKAFHEMGRYTPNWVTDTWNLPSGDKNPKPEHPDNRTPEEKEASRLYWTEGNTHRASYLARLGYKLKENECEYCLRIKKTDNHKCNNYDT
tara:strand:+ start:6381 stop:6683 length:303 start_codon:yes stop_codon:yes gene_type:complete